MSALEGKAGPITTARNSIKAKIAETEPLLQAINDREYWVRVIEDINSRLPDDFIWITELTPPSAEELNKAKPPEPPKKPGAKVAKVEEAAAPEVNITISGLVLENPRKSEVFDDFIKNLEASPYVEPPKNSEKITRPPMRNDLWADKFSFPLRLKAPISLK